MKKMQKCPICKKEMIVEDVEVPLYNGEILVKSEGNYCKNCDEHFFGSTQANSFLDKAELLTKMFHIEKLIRKSGRGYVIPVPKDFMDYYKVKAGEKVSLIPLSEKKMMVEFK